MSTEGPATVHYEVYTLNGQRWTLHARFSRGEKEQALNEAKVVERSIGIAAKVVRETYYPSSNVSEELQLYAGDSLLRANAEKISAAPPGRNRSGGRGASSSQAVSATSGKGQDGSKGLALPGARTSMGILLKLALIVSAALTIAGAVTGVANMMFQNMPSGRIGLSEEALSLTLFAIFVLTFLGTALPMAMTAISWTSGGNNKAAPAIAPAPPPPQPLRQKKRKAAAAVDDQPLDDLDGETDDIDWSGDDSGDDEPLLPPAEEAGENDSKEMLEEPAAEPPPPDTEPPIEIPSDRTEPEDSEETASIEIIKMSMMRFLNKILSEIKKTKPSLDSYNIFGIDLVLAGAIDALGDEHHLETQDKRDILKSAIEVLGTKPATAQVFVDKMEDYLVETKYLAMIQAGRSSMEAFLAGEDPEQDQLSKVFQVWNKPQQGPQIGPRIQTVLFTDMVGSTDLTQSRGDHAAQHIVRRHNSIVRTALAEFSGKEIKHTGDGIMAAFSSAANGVEACVAIQKAIAQHNEKHTDQPLHVRIGINAGEPIEEEDDLFGTTVQLAARVCAKTGTDEIFCTNVVRELSAGKGLIFIDQGVFELKGFKEPIALFQVLWNPAEIARATEQEMTRAAEAASAPSATDA
ncbi:MAG TPA: adenylate/guanylate cyclase domain-containing protein [Rhodospirillaceae bacterium]|nr:adenylate/guanylate cyclase domain-containing protein [Rhodospirillaceae bacterium]